MERPATVPPTVASSTNAGRTPAAPNNARARARATINEAARRTRLIDEQIDAARRSLNVSDVGNGSGIYPDPRAVRSAIIAARDSLQNALNLIIGSEWPSDQDYDQL